MYICLVLMIHLCGGRVSITSGNNNNNNNNKQVLSQRHASPTLPLCPWSKTSYESHLFDQPSNSSVSRPATRDESSALQPRQRHCSKTTTTRARSTDLKIRSTTAALITEHKWIIRTGTVVFTGNKRNSVRMVTSWRMTPRSHSGVAIAGCIYSYSPVDVHIININPETRPRN